MRQSLKLGDSLRVIALDEGSPGHFSQVKGILALLSREGFHLETSRVDARLPIRGIYRGLVRWLIQLGFPGTKKLIGRRLIDSVNLMKYKPDLIISSGGKSAFASKILSDQFQIPNVFVGVPEPFPSQWFSLLISPVRQPPNVPCITTGLIPNDTTPETVKEAGDRYWDNRAPSGACWSLLIGGNSRSHKYTSADWESLTAALDHLAKTNGVKWLITTSRRTPTVVEDLLAEYAEHSEYLESVVLYNREPQKVVKPFMAASSRVFVTQDSLTMASEALCSGLPVTLLQPTELNISPGSYFEEVLGNFHRLQGVDLSLMSLLHNYSVPEATHTQIATLNEVSLELRDKVRELVSYSRDDNSANS